MPEWNVNFVVIADNADAVAALIAEWVVTPGAVLTGVHASQPEVVLHQPMTMRKGGKIGKLKRTPRHMQPTAVSPSIVELPPGDFPDLVPASPPSTW